MSSDAPEAGLFASLRRMLATLLALVYTRIELVAVELDEQLAHAAGIVLWGVAAVFFATLTVLLLALTVVIAFWDGHRLLAAGLVTAGFAVLAVVAALSVRTRLARRPRFLAASTAELRRDAAALDPERR